MGKRTGSRFGTVYDIDASESLIHQKRVGGTMVLLIAPLEGCRFLMA